MIDRTKLKYQKGLNIKNLLNEAITEFNRFECPFQQYLVIENLLYSQVSKEDKSEICSWCSFNVDTIDFYDKEDKNLVFSLCEFLQTIERV